MTNRRAPWTQRAFDLLADGQWHDQADIFDACAGLVPPGVAYRNGERERRHDHDGPRVRGSEEAGMRSGAWRKIRDSLRVQIVRGHFERRYVDGRPQIRIPSRP